MKTIQNLLRTYFQLMSVISPRKAAQQAIQLFQKTQKDRPKAQEISFYQYSRPFQVASEVEAVNCFEIGPKDGPLVLLVHGWNSRAGSMGAIGFRLMKKGYRVVGIDLPGHGKSQLKYTNLIIMEKALRAVIQHLDPQAPISVVAHSFGSAVTSFTLSKMDIEVKNLIFLTSPNKISTVFTTYASQIGLSAKAFAYMKQEFIQIFRTSWDDFVIQDFIAQIPYQSLLMIHDKADKAIPYKNGVEFVESLDRSRLHTLEKVGHYRMLWNKGVIDTIANEFEGKREYTKEEKLLKAAF